VRASAVWYGDDFTGASTRWLRWQVRACARCCSWRAVAQHLRAAGALEALGIAGAARAMDPAAMTAELEPVGRFRRRWGAGAALQMLLDIRQFAHGGQPGTAIDLLRHNVRNAFVPVVGGQPSPAARAPGNLFRQRNRGRRASHRPPPDDELASGDADGRGRPAGHLALQGSLR
jgi:hypothetical protein